MTHEQFAAEYLRREKAANATPQGADCAAILERLCDEHCWSWKEGREAVLDHTITLGGG